MAPVSLRVFLSALALLFNFHQAECKIEPATRQGRQWFPRATVNTCGSAVGQATANHPYAFTNPSYPQAEGVFATATCTFSITIPTGYYGQITCTDVNNGAASTFSYTDGVSTLYALGGAFTYNLAQTTRATTIKISGGFLGAKNRRYSCSVSAIAITSPPTTTNPGPGTTTGCVCGEKVTTRMVTGANVIPGKKYGFMALIEEKSNVLCGGSIISPEYILTSATCVRGKNTGDLKVRLGAHTVDTPGSTELSLSVSQIMIHPEFVVVPQDYDLALLKLSSAVSFTAANGIFPVCLASGTQDYVTTPVTKATGLGWGQTAPTGAIQNILQESEFIVKVNTDTKCTDTMDPHPVNAWHMCFASETPFNAMCPKDEGGPFFITTAKGYYEQIGVVTRGACVDDDSKYDIAARVTSSYYWIWSSIASGVRCTKPV